MGTRLASRPAPPRSRLWPALAAVAVVLIVAGGLFAWRSTATSSAKVSSPTALPARNIDAGEVSVKIQPRQLDARGAVFEVSLETHSGALDLDVASRARLVVGSTTWPVTGWSGDGPGGHHRSGQLRFAPAGDARGTAKLTIGGLSTPVTASWSVGG